MNNFQMDNLVRQIKRWIFFNAGGLGLGEKTRDRNLKLLHLIWHYEFVTEAKIEIKKLQREIEQSEYKIESLIAEFKSQGFKAKVNDFYMPKSNIFQTIHREINRIVHKKNWRV